MNEQQIQAFCKMTGCDKRIAAYCLHKHNGVYEPSIIYYFDNINQIKVPDSFKIENNSAKTSNTKTHSHSSNESFSRMHDLIPTVDIPEYISPDDETETKFFFPNNSKKIESKEVNVQAKNANDADLDYVVPQRNSNKKHKFCKITIWKNGVSVNDKFYSVNDKDYGAIMDDIGSNNIPQSVCTETDVIDLINKSSLSYESKK